jgi:putative transposase
MSKFDPKIHHRRSIRLKEYDYAQAGGYYITIVTWHRECLFGEIVNGEMMLSKHGEIVDAC